MISANLICGVINVFWLVGLAALLLGPAWPARESFFQNAAEETSRSSPRQLDSYYVPFYYLSLPMTAALLALFGVIKRKSWMLLFNIFFLATFTMALSLESFRALFHPQISFPYTSARIADFVGYNVHPTIEAALYAGIVAFAFMLHVRAKNNLDREKY